MNLTERIEILTSQLQKDIYEKQELFQLSMLAMLSGESIFLLGRPGIAKSLVARRLKYAFKNGSIFEYLMNRFSTPEEIFGPISIEDLQHGIYKRIIDKYLPSAEIVFLDEIWKAGPSIQNTLLTIINEKIFRNAGEDIHVPMKLLISASNELPAEGQGLEALFDRFIIRYVAEGLKNAENFNQMLQSVTSLDVKIDNELKITNEEYDIWRAAIDKITISDKTFDFIHRFRKKLFLETEGECYISDRRWKKIAHLMKTSAFFNGREVVDKPDWCIIKYCIWDNEEQFDQYGGIFTNAYLDGLTYDIKQQRITLDEKLIKLSNKLDNLNEMIVRRNQYQDIFDNSFPGSYERILWNNSECPIAFISAEDSEKIMISDSPIPVTFYCGEFLDKFKKTVTENVIKVDDHSFKNAKTNEIYQLEVKNVINDKDEKKIEFEIGQIEREINKTLNIFNDERTRLMNEKCIFFADLYNLFLINAFTSDKEQEFNAQFNVINNQNEKHFNIIENV